MTQTAILTKWKFVVEFEDDETKEISGTLGQADTREECEAYIENEVQYLCSHGKTPVNTEAGEVCAKCHGEGKISAGNDGQVICQACGGHLGPITPFAFYLNKVVPKRTESSVITLRAIPPRRFSQREPALLEILP